MRLQGLVHVVHEVHVRRVVEVPGVQEPLDLDVPFLGQGRGLGLLFYGKISVFLKARDDAVDLVVFIGGLFRGAGDDERGPGLVDQDGVHFVDNGVVELALGIVLQVELHVVAKVVEAELVVRAVGHVGAVGHLPFLVREPVDDDPHREAEELIHRPHPLGVAPRQVIVHRDHVHAAAGQCVQVHRERRDERFSFAGLHLGDPARVKDDAADELGVEVPHAERAFRCLAHHRKGLGKNVVERLAVGETLLELVRLCPQACIRQPGGPLLERVYLVHQRLDALEFPLVRGAEYFFQDQTDHFTHPHGAEISATVFYIIIFAEDFKEIIGTRSVSRVRSGAGSRGAA